MIQTPKKWTIEKLGNLGVWSGGGTPSKSNPKFWAGGTIPWVSPKDMKFVSIDDTQDYITESAVKGSATKILPKGSLLIVTRSGILQHSLPVATNSRDVTLNQDLKALTPKEGFEVKYLYFALRRFERDILHKCCKAGTTVQSIEFPRLKDFEIPIAPLTEQRRIVARIEELFSRLDAGVAALRHAKAQLQRYRQSVLAAAVTGSLPGLQPTQPDSWHPISEVIQTLDQGWSPKCESVCADSEDEWAVIKTTAIQAGSFLDYENKKLPTKLEPRAHLELKTGDLLLTRAGPRSRVGVACYVRKVRPKLMLCDKAYRVRLKPKMAIPGFIELVLNSPRFVDALDEMKSGISDSGLNLTQKRFSELLIPLPPLAEQYQIVAEVEVRTTAIDHLEAELDRQITRSDRLRQSTLSSAFSGAI
jgi:type I restriction enzyme S subunit